MKLEHPPYSTYRIQCNHLTFKEGQKFAVYFSELGISHLYTSPLQKAKRGSTHGYDVIDYSQLNPEIGTLQEFEDFVNSLRAHSLKIILDIVPNHMYIGNHENMWWNSVLEKGEDSPFASFFDINWHPPKKNYDNKVFLPCLDQRFGEALENQFLNISYEQGYFFLNLKNLKLPTAPETWYFILKPLLEDAEKLLSENDENIAKLKEILKDLSTPHIHEKIELFFSEPVFQKKLEKMLEVFNGTKNYPSSFNQLEEFLNAQHYRLCYWRVANEEINYRRFFDIFEFACIRIENEETFKAVHQLIFDFLRKDWIDGLRIDHIDGLWDPQQYLNDLSQQIYPRSTYIIAEKILLGNEKLRLDWPLQGVVGYDFLNLVNGLFVYQEHQEKIKNIYYKFTGLKPNLQELQYQCKKIILKNSLASELHLLTLRLSRIAENHRYYQDFTFENLKQALAEIIAYFPVYRTYIQANLNVIHEDDRKVINEVFTIIRDLNKNINLSLFEFIEDTLLFKYPDGIEESFKTACKDFVMHFQQVTGPVMAKGLEDTAFYRYFPLSSLNEVGALLDSFGTRIETFHEKNIERFANWPHSQLSTTTHDTKRSEDVRARINLLSEIPDEWEVLLSNLNSIAEKYKTEIDKKKAPDSNEEYLIYQTLLGTWPFTTIDEVYIKRIQSYMQKAIKEAKVNNNWLDPHTEYEEAINHFIAGICKDSEFLQNMLSFVNRIAELGMLNSLSQVILKLTSPGVPDIYQGNELWDFSLVDPDNRKKIDFSSILEQLASLKSFEKCFKTPRDGSIKLFITSQLLHLRKRLPQIFTHGLYLALNVIGPKADFVIAYARIDDGKFILAICARFFSFFMNNFHGKKDFWQDTVLELPDELALYQLKNVFTQQLFTNAQTLPLQSIFCDAPFAVLESH